MEKTAGHLVSHSGECGAGGQEGGGKDGGGGGCWTGAERVKGKSLGVGGGGGFGRILKTCGLRLSKKLVLQESLLGRVQAFQLIL